MYNSDPKVAAAQKVMLEILLEVHRVCIENDIVYWLEGGTLLGSVRHGGFIPWDDDIDISMDRYNYNKFLAVAGKSLRKGFFLQTRTTDKAFPLELAKVRRDNTLLIETGETGEEPYHHGIFIDIIPNAYYNSEFFTKWMRWSVLVKDRKKKYKKGSLKRLLVTLYTNIILCLPAEVSKFIRKWLSNHKEYFLDKNDKFLSHGLEFGFIRDTETKDILPVKLGTFEGYSFYVPNNPHNYLVKYYGEDYMQLPPAENRIIHNQKIEIFEGGPQ